MWPIDQLYIELDLEAAQLMLTQPKKGGKGEEGISEGL